MPGAQINITLGTAGHIDHGKTALVKLLTGCDTDRLKEEKERGISIDLGFAPCTVGDLEIGIVDVPGHEHFIKTMVAGACGMDAVLLVVAADDGVMPQTREHLEILTLLGVRHGFVALTKIDRVEPDYRQLVQEETRAFLQNTFLAQAPICPISSITGEGFDEFYQTLTGLLAALRPKPLDGVFRLPVDRAFSARGYGTVVAGIPVCGSIGLDGELVLLPDGQLSSIRQIEVYGRSSEVVKAGQCAAICVRHWDAKRIRRGHVVTLPGYFTPGQWFVGRLQLLPHEQIALKNGSPLKFHTGTSEVTATAYLLEGNRAEAGDVCLAQFCTSAPLVAGPGDPFIVRSLSPVRTIGGGVIIEGLDRKLKRTAPGLLDDVRRRCDAIAEPHRFVEYAVRRAPSHAAGEADLAVRTKTRPADLRAILAGLTDAGLVWPIAPGLFIHRDTVVELSRRVADLIAQFHRDSPGSVGISLDQLRERLPLDRPLLDHVLTKMKAAGQLVERNAFWAAPGHAAVFAGDDAAHVEAIEALFREAWYRPPGIDEVCQKTGIKPADVRRLLKMLVEHQRLVRVDADTLFHSEAVDAARDLLVDFIRKEGRLESVKFKYLLDTSRRFAIPLLDYLDTLGITRRDGHTRYLKDAR